MPETKRKVIKITHFKHRPAGDFQILGSREEAEQEAKNQLQYEVERGAEWRIVKIEIYELLTTWTPQRYKEMRAVQEGQSS
jgi:hypothetical protein